jgi:hypothetical protein
MKKIFLLCVVALSFMTADAQQTKKSSKKKAKTTKASKSKAEAARLERERYEKAETARLDMLRYDSIRRETDRLNDSTFDVARMAWKDSMLRTIDSNNNVNWKAQMAQHEQKYMIDRSRDEVIRAAKLTGNQGRQVKYINQVYHEKARVVRQDSTLTEEQKTAQYMALNTERRNKIKAIVGSSKEKKLEKERQEYRRKNSVDADEAWIDAVASKKN